VHCFSVLFGNTWNIIFFTFGFFDRATVFQLFPALEDVQI
jgi:hypothetical protein